MGALKWPIGRLTRSDTFFAVLLLNIAFIAIDWFAFKRINLMLNFGFRFDAIIHPEHLPIWRLALELIANLALGAIAIARLHDASYSARFLIGIIALSIVSMIPSAGSLALIALIGWIVIFFLPPSIGPNQFGADPRGWKSREHFEDQQRTLAEQQKR